MTETEIPIEIVPSPPLPKHLQPRADAVSAASSLEMLLSQGPVRIAYIAGQFPLSSETFVYREVRELRKRGWYVTAVSLRAPRGESAESPDLDDLRRNRLLVYGRSIRDWIHNVGSEVLNHFPSTFKTLRTAVNDALSPGESLRFKTRLRLIPQAMAAIGISHELRENGTSHIHCHFAHAPTTVGMYAAMQMRIPFSFTGHANDLFQRRALLKRKLERAEFVSCISRWHREYYREISPGNDGFYPVIRCGVDTKSWTTEHPEIIAPQTHVVTVCRLVEKKGVDLLIRGLAAWKPPGGWKLTIAGDGRQREVLERLARGLNVQKQVEFLGAVDNDRVRNLLQSANVFALACRTDASGDRDGIPVALMEAMACGVPVISGDLPAIRELVVPRVSGLLVNSSFALEWADALNQLTSDTALRQSLIDAGRSMVLHEFDLETNVTRLQGMLEQSVKKSRGSFEADTAVVPAVPVKGSGRRYVLITPCRDEARYARRTLDSVTGQTIPPALWVIVDDGSRDQTPEILAEYAARYPYIKIIRRADRGDRKLGGGVIDAFYTGYESINPNEFDYVCKLDLDLDLPFGYFEILMNRMELNPRLGTASGKPFFFKDGKAISEMCGDENSVGMIKFYRLECFKQIGGFVRELMWDGIDCHRCRQLGWIAVSWDEPSIRFEHLRPMGTSHKNWWTGRTRHGIGQYFMGTGPIYMLASAIFRMTRPPLLVGGTAMLWGYFKSALQHNPRYGDPDFREFLRTYQWDCLLRGKPRATESLNLKQQKVWRVSAESD